jgi:molybdate transport system ATP-binding protein
VAPPTLSVRLERTYRGGPSVGADFNLDLEPPGTLVFFGPSGSGKTTILRCLAGLDLPDAGRIVCGDDTWFDSVARVCVPPQRRHIGYLPQGFGLFPHLSVFANLAYGVAGAGRADREQRIRDLVTLLRLEGLESRRPGQLSSGQQQRVALGRALARRPRLLLLDEPLSSLDAPTREELRVELRGLLRSAATPAIVVTHDRGEALALADQVAIVIGGSIRQIGRPEEVFDRPANEELARTIGVETIVRGLIMHSQGGVLAIRVGDARVTALGDAPAGADVLVSIRAEEVVISAEAGMVGTAATGAAADATGPAAGAGPERNRLNGRVVATELRGPLLRVALDVGFRLIAVVTRQTFADLRVAPGDQVTALVSAAAVHVIRLDPDSSPPTLMRR